MGVLFTIAYDGTNYCGWQTQINAVSVQDVFQSALKSVIGNSFGLLGASRTDAGVHAMGQRAHLICKNPIQIPTKRLPYVLNGILPQDIKIIDAIDVPNSFHPISDAVSKTYTYCIINNSCNNPLKSRYCAFVPRYLNISTMQAAAKHFIGTHDFAAFCSTGTIVNTTTRTINFLNISKDDNIITITINGNGFLYNMVRIIAGTLVDVGFGKTKADDIPDIICSKSRQKCGKTMAAKGLTLQEVFY